MDLSTLQNWLWRAACSIRGEVDAARYKDYILPLLFYKRLNDVFQDEVLRVARNLSGQAEPNAQGLALAEEMIQIDRSLARFYLPPETRWGTIRSQTTHLGQRLTDALRTIARENDRLQGVIDRRDFNATEQGQRILDDDTLARLIEILNEHGLGFRNVAPDILGRAYEYLIRKFAERGSSAGEFFTPTEVGFLIAHILDPQPGESFYDPASGSAGLLIKAQLRHKEKVAQQLGKAPEELAHANDPAPLQLHGQEIQPDNIATALMNAFLHDMGAQIELGNTMRNPRFLNENGSLRRFDKVCANPMWNQAIAAEIYENDTFNRFSRGIPPTSSADWGWVQHMVASLEPGGRMAVVLDTGAASRGSGNQGANKERDIRAAFVGDGMVEAVILLPENLFFNTSAPGIILVMRKPLSGDKEAAPDDILLVNASKFFVKGRPKNEMSDEHIAQIADLLLNRQEQEGVSKLVTVQEAARNDYNLSPSRYVSTNDVEPPLPLEDAVVLLQEAEEHRQAADEDLRKVLDALGLSL